MLKNVIVPDQIFTVSNVLSPEECAEYITLTENIGYTPAGLTVGQDEYMMAPQVRNNDRVILDDEQRHEGDRVIHGRKYVLRSDVMYTLKRRGK